MLYLKKIVLDALNCLSNNFRFQSISLGPTNEIAFVIGILSLTNLSCQDNFTQNVNQVLNIFMRFEKVLNFAIAGFLKRA